MKTQPQEGFWHVGSRGWLVLLAGLAGLGMALLVLAEPVRPAVATVGRDLWARPTAISPAYSPAAVLEQGPPSPAAGVQGHRIVATIPLTPGIGQAPAAIAADPRSPLVYVANAESGDITVLSGTVPLGMVAAVNEGVAPAYSTKVAVHPSTGLLYAVEETGSCPYEKDMIMQVVSGTQVLATVSVGGCWTDPGACGTTDMAFQPATGYMYLLQWYSAHYLLPTYGSIAILEGTTVITKASFEDTVPLFVATDPQRGYVYVSADITSTDAVLVLSGTSLLGQVPVPSAGQVEVQPRTGLAYIQSGADHLAILSGTADLGEVMVGEIAALAADPSRGYLYVSHPHTPTVTIVSGTAVLTDVAVISPAGWIEVNSSTGLTYLRHPEAPFVTVLSGTAVLTEVEVLSGSGAIESNPTTGLVYAVDSINSVAVLQGIQRLTTIPPASPQPRAMEVHPLTGQIVVLSSPPALSFIQGQTIVATVPLTITAEQMLIHPTTGLIYLASHQEDTILVLSGTTLQATVPVSGYPEDIAVQPRTGLVYFPDNTGTLNVISGTTRISALPLGHRELAHVAAHPDSGLIYVTDPWSDTVHILSGTAVVTDVLVGSWPHEIAIEPRSGYIYVASSLQGTQFQVISATRVLTAVSMYPATVVDMQPSPTSGYLYLHLRTSAISWCSRDRIGIVEGTEEVTEWTFPDATLLSCLEPHPSMGYVYAGHAVYGSLLSIGVGAVLVQTMPVGDGSWVRAIAVDPGTDRVYVATDHAIAILEEYMPYHFYLHLVLVHAPGGNRTEGP